MIPIYIAEKNCINFLSTVILLSSSTVIQGLTIPRFIHDKKETFKDEDWEVSHLNFINTVPIKYAPVTTPKNFQNGVLTAHNKFRQLHGVPPLELSDELSSSAQWWSGYLAKKSQHQQWPMIFHSHFQNIGENIWAAVGLIDPPLPPIKPNEDSDNNDPNFFYKFFHASDPVQSWYSEMSQYSFDFDGDEPPFKGSTTRHFSQLLWKNSRQLGVAGHRNSEGHVYVVCHYRPEGNIGGQFLQNVIQPMWFQRKLTVYSDSAPGTESIEE